VGFVGRERELSSLRGALGGDTRLLLVAGDAGVGKTRLVGEGMRRAAADGMVSVLGAAAGRGAAAAAAGGGGTEAGHGPLQGDLTRAAASCVRRLRYMSGPTRLVAPTPTIAAAAISQPAGSHTGALIAGLYVNSIWSTTRLHAGGGSVGVDPAVGGGGLGW
jgi:hypothetical protein